MKRGDFIETVEGQAHLRQNRKVQRIYAHASGEPRSKKTVRTAEKIAFQATADEWMRRLRLSPLRGPVVVDMIFTALAPNPPSIEKLPKNYLDLLERRVDARGAFTDQKLVFLDDRQVKALFVRHNIGLGSSPGIHATITAQRHFMADLELVRRIEEGNFRTRDGFGHRGTPDGGRLFEQEHESVVEQARQDLRELDRWPESFRVQFGPAFEEMQLQTRYQAQRALLAHTDDFIGMLLLDLPDLWRRKQSTVLANSLRIGRQLLLSQPVAVALMHAPRRDGDGARFDEVLVAALDEFESSHPSLFPILTQLGVSLFHVPPDEDDGGIEGKDLDNLARLVIPRIQERFNPPATLWHAHHRRMRRPTAGTAGRSASDDHQANVHKRLPGAGITRYLAIELPRMPRDPRDGMVAIAFGDGEAIPSVWNRIDTFIDGWAEGR